MQLNGDQIQVSAGDLAKHLACQYLTSLDLKAAYGEIERAYHNAATKSLTPVVSNERSTQ